MPPKLHERDGSAVWDVARPKQPSRIPGVSMAGFRDRGVSAAAHRAVPHPSVSLALELGAGALLVDDPAGRRVRGSVAAGLGFGSGTPWVRGERFEAVQVRLSPLVAGAILGVSPAELSGAVVGLDELWGREASQIRERLDAASSWPERFALTDAFLAHRHARPSLDPEVAWAWRRIVAGRGLTRVDGLAAEVGWSRKRLWSRFRSQIGLPPKRAATLVRFDHAAHRLAQGEDAARVAAETGYADQSHLHRDVVAFTGTTPTKVAGELWLAIDEFAWPTTPKTHKRPKDL
ncbi:helix-turn-helix domain-containing protein [Actinomadura decatromicini]|uniref:AraC family transcriptional regulator n=1 Tax=Actinomadura decatromicini TaxID=2604572 RepID=A0A5D3FYM8_9ACTN|nr:helix-turn-helix domain-containing protein [Actinomadura decatromicini]TYK52840.1 AraC family transcriptional regulator [Actinomadura decatromicini]